jgi:hypothetical protein
VETAAYASKFVSEDNEAILYENQFGEGGIQRKIFVLFFIF